METMKKGLKCSIAQTHTQTHTHTHTQTLTLHHVPVGVVCDGVDVWRHLVAFLALIHLDDLFGVDGQHLVGIHHHAEQTRVRLWRAGIQETSSSSSSYIMTSEQLDIFTVIFLTAFNVVKVRTAQVFQFYSTLYFMYLTLTVAQWR